MLDIEIRNKMINKLSVELSPELGLPVDIIERALKKAFKKVSEDNAFDNSSYPSPTTPTTPSTPSLSTSIPNDIQVLEPVDELSRGSAFNSNHNSDNDLKAHKNQQDSSSQASQKNRKDSLSSLIEITQSGSTSINIKLPSLYVPQKESNNQNIKPTNSINENSSRSGSILHSDEHYYYNNKNTMQNRQMDSIHNDLNSTEYIPSQRRESPFDIQTDNIQNTYKSFTPEVQNRQIDSENVPRRKDSSDVYNQRQQGESIVDQVEVFDFDPKPSDYINNDSDPYKSDSDNSCVYNSQVPTSHQQPNSNQPRSHFSEWPTLSEATKKGDSRKNSEIDLGAWGQMSIASAWGKPKKWSSETETKKPEHKPPANTWNPDDVNHLTWTPLQESKTPLFRKKKNAPVQFELDDNDGWGAPPTKYTAWEDDEKQGYCYDLIQEQKETVFWTKQNDVWVNVSEEVKITQEKRVVERSSDGANQRDFRQTRTQTQRIERQGTGREQLEKENENIIIELTDDETNSKIDSQSNSAKPRDRIGNPQWKSEDEWRAHNSVSGDEHFTSDKDENELTSNWDDFLQTTEESVDTVKDDTWSSEDEQEDMINEHEQSLLINVDSNSDNITSESTIINTHPPIYHGTISNTMADSNDIILDYTNPANITANVNIINNPDLNLLSFDDDEDNNKSNSSDNITSIERQPQENGNSYNFDEFEVFLKNNKVMHNGDNGDNGDNKHEVGLTNHSNEPQSAITDNYESSRYMPSFNSSTDTSSSKPYYYEDSSQSNIESIASSSALNVEGKDDERAHITNGYESSRFVPSFNSPADIPPSKSSKSYYYEDSSQPNIEPITFDDKRRVDESKSSNNEIKSNSTKSDYVINITVETPSDGRQMLRLRLDDDPQETTAEFCRKWGMTNLEDALEGLVQKEKRKRLRKRKIKMVCK